jgi:hypothetical protein
MTQRLDIRVVEGYLEKFLWRTFLREIMNLFYRKKVFIVERRKRY